MNMNSAKRVGMFLSIFAICSSINASSYVPAKVMSNSQAGIIVSFAGTLAAVPYIVKQIDHNKFDGFSLQQIICGFAIAAAAAIPFGLCVNQLSPEKQQKRSEAVIKLLNEDKVITKLVPELKEIFQQGKGKKEFDYEAFSNKVDVFCNTAKSYDILALYNKASYLESSYSKEVQRLKRVKACLVEDTKKTQEVSQRLESAKKNAGLTHYLRVGIENLDRYQTAERAAYIRSKRSWMNYLGAVAAILTSPLLISGLQTIFNKLGISIDLSDLLPQPTQIELTILQK